MRQRRWVRPLMAFSAMATTVAGTAYVAAPSAQSSGTAYASAVTADTPSVYYRLDESAGTTAADTSGHGNAGTYGVNSSSGGITYGVTGALTDTDDASDTAITADGSVTVPVTSNAAAGPSGDGAWTMEAWYRSKSTSAQTVVSIGNAGYEQAAGMSVWPANGSTPGYSLGIDLYQASVQWDGLNLNDGRWHQLAVSYSGAGTAAAPGFSAYVDGQPLGAARLSKVTFPLNLDPAGPARVGGWTDTSYEQPLNGSVDEAAVYPTALPAARIAAHYAAAGTRPGAARNVKVSLSSPSVTADGTSTVTATATVTDGQGQNVPGDTVTFTSSDTAESVAATTQNPDGTYSATITASPTVGSALITATDSTTNPALTGTATLKQTPGSAANISVSLNPAALPADKTSMGTATVTVTDAGKNPLPGEAANLIPSVTGDPDLQVGAVKDLGDGTYTFPYTAGSTAGRPTITVTDGSATPGTATLEEYAPAASAPPVCTDTWSGAANDSNWSTAGNWSTNAVPGPTDVACLPSTPFNATSPATYTVNVLGTVSVGQVVVGDTDTTDTQTLAIVGQYCPTTGELDTDGGYVAPGGIIDLTSNSSCGTPAAVLKVSDGHTLTNLGVVRADNGSGGSRYVTGSVVNEGQMVLDSTGLNLNQAGAVLDNRGAIHAAGNLALAAVASGSPATTLVNDTNGSIDGTGTVYVNAGDTLVQGAGTVDPKVPVWVSGGSGLPTAIDYTGAGSSTINVHDAVSLAGNIESGQRLNLQGTYCPDNATATAAGDFTNDGVIDLTSDNSCGGAAAILTGPAGATLKNTGTVLADPGQAGARYLRLNVLNTGTVTVNTQCSQNYGGQACTFFDQPGTTFDNRGTLTLNGGLVLPLDQKGSAASATFASTAGTISADANGWIFVDGGNTWVQGGGALTAGSAAPILQGWAGGISPTTLRVTGTGPVKLALRDKVTMAGDLAAGQELDLQGQGCPDSAVLTATGDWTNGGLIDMTSLTTCGPPSEYVITPAGSTLVNTGTIVTDPTGGGTRYLEGNIVNAGAMVVKAATRFDRPGTTLDNKGELVLLGSGSLDVPYNAGGLGSPTAITLDDDTGGDIGGTGPVTMEAGNQYVQGDGTVSDVTPIAMSGANGVSVGLSFTGSGTATVDARDLISLSGDIAAGQSLVLQGMGCPDQAVAVASGSFTNSGTIELTSTTTCGPPSEYLQLPRGATLTNQGTILTDPTGGGNRYLEGSIVNTGTVTVNSQTWFDQPGSVFDNQGTVALASQLTLPYANVDSQAQTEEFKATSGRVTGSNLILVDGGNTYVQGAGKLDKGSPAAIITGNSGFPGTLELQGTGSSTFDLRDQVSLSGDVAAGQTLVLQGQRCPDTASVTAAASFTNAGTIDLSNIDGCGTPESVLHLPTGDTLTNADTGTIETDPGAGGWREIDGPVVNTGTILAGSGMGLTITGAVTNNGTVDVRPNSGLTLSVAPTDAVAPTLDGIWLLGSNVTWPGAGPFTSVTGTLVRNGGTIVDSNTNKDALTGVGEIAAGGDLGVLQSTLADSATLNVDGTLDLSDPPGSLGAYHAALTTQGYTQSDTGTLKVSVSRVGSSIVAPAGGAATLGGALAVTTDGRSTIPPGSRYQIVSTSSKPSGTFASVTGNADPDQTDYAVSYENDGVWLTVSTPTTSTLASSAANNASVYGGPVTFTATVAVTSGAVPSGQVTFTDGTTAICTDVAVTPSTATTATATCTTSSLDVAAHTVRAVFADSTLAYGGSTAAVTQTVSKVGTTTTAAVTSGAKPATSVEYGTPLTFSASVAPTEGSPSLDGPAKVGFAVTNGASTDQPAACSALDLSAGSATCTVSDLPAGAQSVVAAYTGDANSVASTSPAQPYTITPRATGASLASSSTPAAAGQPVTLTLTVNALDAAPAGLKPAGRANFFDTTTSGSQLPIAGCADVTVAAGTAACTTSALTPGTHSLTAVFTDPAGNFATVSAGLAQIVGQTGVTVASDGTPSTYGNPVKYTANVTGTGTLGGTVTFTDSANGAPGTPLCSAVAVTDNGSGTATATCTDPGPGAAVHQITATYSGDAANGPSSGTFDQLVRPATTTVTVTSGQATSTYGDTVTFTASVSAGAGSVSFTDQPLSGPATSICGKPVALTGGRAQCTVSNLTPGVHDIRAYYAGDANHAASSGSAGQLVNLAATTTTLALTTGTDPSGIGDSLTFTAGVTGAQSPGGTVSFDDVAPGGTTVTICKNVNLTAGQALCTVSDLSTGGHAIVARYSGDPVNAASTATLGHGVQRSGPKTTVTLQTGHNPATTGDTLTYVATETGGTSPTGTVDFLDVTSGSTTALCSAVAVTSGAASCTTSGLAAGNHAVVAEYSGDANNTSSAGTYAETVNPPAKAQTATALALGAGQNDPSVVGAPIGFTATVTGGGTPTGTVTFTDITGGTGTDLCSAVALDGNGTATCTPAQPLTVGSHAIIASYGGDTGHAASEVTITHTVVVAPTTTAVALTSGGEPSTAGDAVTFTATVANGTATAPTGTVQFYDFSDGGSPQICSSNLDGSGKATCTTSALTVGGHAIVAEYSGDGGNGTSQGELAHTVQAAGGTASTTTSVARTAGTDPSAANQPLTFTATVAGGASPTGTVTFTDVASAGQATLCSATLNAASATCSTTASSLFAGANAIIAVYSGDSGNGGSSAVMAQGVRPGTPTMALQLTGGSDPATAGAAQTFTAKVTGGSSPTGTVTFQDVTPTGSTSPCPTATLSAGSATCTFTPAVGSHTIVASYSGDPSNAAATASAVDGVTPAAPAVSLARSAGTEPSVTGSPLTFTAAITGGDTPTGKVTFRAVHSTTSTVVCDQVPLSGGSASCDFSSLAVGDYAIVATYSGDQSNSSVSDVASQSVVNPPVSPTSTAVTRTTGQNPSQQGSTVGFTASVSGGTNPTGTVDFEAIDPSGASTPLCSGVTLAGGKAACSSTASGSLPAGSYAIVAIYSGDSANGTSTGSLAQQVDAPPRATTMTALALAQGTNPATTGDALTFEATVTGGSKPTGSVTFTDVGPSGTSTALCTVAVQANGIEDCTPSGADQLGTGAHAITAAYDGDSTNAPSSATIAEAVNQPAPTSTGLTLSSDSINPTPAAGATITFTAKVTGGSNPTGTVTFEDIAPTGPVTPALCSAVAVSGGTATCSTSSVPVGSNAIVATYSGDANNAGSEATISQPVNPKPLATTTTTLTLVQGKNPATTGDTLTFEAAVSGGTSPSGSVIFTDVGPSGTSVTLCSVAVQANGIEDCTPSGAAQLGTGAHAVTASYSGDSANAPSSATISEAVNQPAPAATGMSLSSNSVSPVPTAGSPITFTATVTGGSNPTGTVTFQDIAPSGPVTPDLCSAVAISAGVATCSTSAVPVGSNAIVARYSGDANNSASTATISQPVNPAPLSASTTTVTTSAGTSAPAPGTAIKFTATVTGSGPTPTGTVTFFDTQDGQSEIALCSTTTLTLDGTGKASCTTTSLSSGTHAVSARYSGDSHYSLSTGSVPQVVAASSTYPNACATAGLAQSGSLLVASATGCPNPIYQFLQYSGSTWQVVRGWSTTSTYALPTTPGTYTYAVWVKDSSYPSGDSFYDVYAVRSVSVAATPCSATMYVPSSATVGSATTLSVGNLSGYCQGATFEYWVYSSNTGWQTIGSGYTSSTSVSFTPSLSGTYYAYADILVNGAYTSTANEPSFPVQPQAHCSASPTVSITPAVSPSQQSYPVGQTFTVSASETGCHPVYSYLLYDTYDSTWRYYSPGSNTYSTNQASQVFTSQSSFTWNTTGDQPGTYYWFVEVRDISDTSGSTINSEAYTSLANSVPCTKPSGQPTLVRNGTTVTVTMPTPGSCSAAEYHYMFYNWSSGAWQAVQFNGYPSGYVPYQSVTVSNLPSAQPTYFDIWVRVQGATYSYDYDYWTSPYPESN